MERVGGEGTVGGPLHAAPGFEESPLEVRLTRPGHLAPRIGLDEAERQQRERQHQLLNALDQIVKHRESWGWNLRRIDPEDLTAEAAQLLAAGIEPDLIKVEDDLRAIRQDLTRLNEAPAAVPARRRRTSRSRPAG